MRTCAVFFQAQPGTKTKNRHNFREENAKLFESRFIKNAFKNTKICAVVKNKKSIKNLVIKTKI